jgi:hypothetical protein
MRLFVAPETVTSYDHVVVVAETFEEISQRLTEGEQENAAKSSCHFFP